MLSLLNLMKAYSIELQCWWSRNIHNNVLDILSCQWWYCDVPVYVAIHFVIACDLFSGRESVHVFFSYNLLHTYIWPLEVQLSREEGQDPINWYIPVYATHISNIIGKIVYKVPTKKCNILEIFVYI